MRRLVIVESPYAGNITVNERYARAAVRDCLERGECPIASHLLFTQPGILREDVAEDRGRGVMAGLEWYRVADLCALYTDRGISPGMRQAMAYARDHGVRIEGRRLWRPR